MNKIWTAMLLPKAAYAKWLVLAALIGLAWLWAHGHFDVAQKYLDTERFTFIFGDFKLSAYNALKSVLFVIIIGWVTSIILETVNNRIAALKKVDVGSRALLQKILQIIIYILAFLITLNILGIDLTSLTVLSGALGIGIGFGLQKIAANFISGMILLFERSLKPGDLIELEGGITGYVRHSSSRATLIETIDGKEVLVPNEEFIVKQVINWTLNNPSARVTITLGVSYGSDIEKARALILEAANAHPRCVTAPEPTCFLDNFGDNSVDFIAYFWVDDINQGFRNIKSEILFSIWHKFKEHNIEIPFPQRDLHIKTPSDLSALIEQR